ncbi:MAG TPA: plasmid pRiA4b ORF-3 family protein [Ktedonobacterales bacterium]|nr:plasmid pRiA4b ORF-3 family protein [Ktedonobacterales bacterium]
MPKKRGPRKSDLALLAQLPRRADLTILGGKRQLGLYLREGSETFQAQLVIWLDEPGGILRTSDVINPLANQDDGVTEALETLTLALIQPPPTPISSITEAREGKKSRAAVPQVQRSLPARLIINDEPLAQAAQDIFGPLGVEVAYQSDIPAFDAAFQSLAQQLGADEDAGPPEPFAWDAPEALLTPLYAAAAGLWRREPWLYLPDHPPLVITLGEQGPQPDVPTLYACILGGAGLAEGVAFYNSLEAFQRVLQHGREAQANNPFIDQAVEMLRQSGVPIDQIPPDEVRMVLGQLLGDANAEGQDIWNITEEGFVCFFTPKDDCDPTYLDWMAAHGLKPASREGVPTFLKTFAGQEPQEPTDEREIKALTLALEALNQFFSHFRATLEAPLVPDETLTHRARLGGGITVEVSFTPSEDMYEEWLDDETLEEPDEPASEAAQTTLYRFQVKLDWMKSVWRRIEMRGDQTLHDLHEAIQQAFNWDNDHLYAFFLSGKPWDRQTAYESPFGEGERSAAKYRLEHLSLQPGQQIAYIFDFGDELDHRIKLEAIIPGGTQPGGDYPQITERHGEAPPQYPTPDGE